MSIEKSMVTERIAGTKNFSDPEAEATGIFTPASDVYSLGEILKKIYYELEILTQYSNVSNEVKIADKQLHMLISELTDINPSRRLTVRKALGKFHDFATKNTIQGFNLHGMGWIFLRIGETLDALDILNSSTSSTSIPVAEIENFNLI